MQVTESSADGFVRFAISLISPKIEEISVDNQIRFEFPNSSRFLSVVDSNNK